MLINTKEYLVVVENINAQIASTQQRVIWGANRELITLYWNIGKSINEHKTWGSKFIENLAREIKSAFPNLRGFSFRNLKYMSQFASIYKVSKIGQEPPAQLTWTHNTILMDRIKNKDEML